MFSIVSLLMKLSKWNQESMCRSWSGGAHTKRPITKRPRLKTAQAQNGPSSKQPKLKTTHSTKRPMAQNDPRHKTTQGTKRPKAQTDP
jgi:hypothetical protein